MRGLYVNVTCIVSIVFTVGVFAVSSATSSSILSFTVVDGEVLGGCGGHVHNSPLFLKLHDLDTLSYFNLKLPERDPEFLRSDRPLKLLKKNVNFRDTF